MPQVQKPPDILDHEVSLHAQVNKPPDVLDDTPDTPPSPHGDTYSGPDTFMSGVLNSGHDVMDAMLSGAKGFLKGATVDIPSTVMGAAKHAYDHPIDTILSTMGPLGDVITGNDTMAPLRDASAHAGGNPEAFGRILGQLAGQPAVMDGALSLAPSATRLAGTPVAAAGRVMKDYQPLSGMLPGMIEPRLLRVLEKAAGSGIESIGNWMRKPSPAMGEVMPQEVPSTQEGNFYEVPPTVSNGLPPSATSFYGAERNPIPPQELPGSNQLQLPPSNTHYAAPSPVATPKAIGGYNNQLPPSNVHYMGDGSQPFDINITAPNSRPRMRVNSEGNVVDLGTGQVMDTKGNTISYPSKLADILSKPFHEMTEQDLQTLQKMNLDKNVASTVNKELKRRAEMPKDSPFFYKNRH